MLLDVCRAACGYVVRNAWLLFNCTIALLNLRRASRVGTPAGRISKDCIGAMLYSARGARAVPEAHAPCQRRTRRALDTEKIISKIARFSAYQPSNLLCPTLVYCTMILEG